MLVDDQHDKKEIWHRCTLVVSIYSCTVLNIAVHSVSLLMGDVADVAMDSSSVAAFPVS